MANSASDARGSEMEIRRQLIEDRCVDVIVSVGTNFFYTVTLPVTLWFLDRGKRGTERADQVLFIDARNIYRQIDRAHRDWAPEQIEFLANIVRLLRGEEPEFEFGSDALFLEHFPDKTYVDVAGLCAVSTISNIEERGWSLNPGRYIKAESQRVVDEEFDARMELLSEEFELLNAESTKLVDQVRGVLGIGNG
jgi:type I restriction enzyme M protein